MTDKQNAVKLLRAVLVGAALALTSTPATGQGMGSGRSIWVEGGYFPSATFRDSPLPDLTNSGLRTGTFAAGASLPLVLGDPRTMLLLDVSYRQVRLGRVDFPSTVTGRLTPLHSVDLGASFVKVLSPTWTAVFRAGVGIASDFEGEASVSDARPSVVAMFTRPLDAQWTLSLGAAYAPGSAFAFPLPVVGAAWSNGGRWRASVGAPTGAEAWYALADRGELGFRASIEGGEYRTHSLEAAGEPLLRRLGVTVGPAASLRIGGGATLDLAGGIAFQSLRLSEQDDSAPDVSLGLESVPFFRTTLRLDW